MILVGKSLVAVLEISTIGIRVSLSKDAFLKLPIHLINLVRNTFLNL